jgi:hypothetical protein
MSGFNNFWRLCRPLTIHTMLLLPRFEMFFCRSFSGAGAHCSIKVSGLVPRCPDRILIQTLFSVRVMFYQISPCSAQIVNLYRKTLEKLFEKDDFHRKDAIQRTKKELSEEFVY